MMNILTIHYPNDSNILINFNSGQCQQNFGITGVTGLITGSGILIGQLLSGIGIQTNKINILSAASPYTGEILLKSGVFAGAIMKYILNFASGLNQNVQIVDETTNQNLLFQSGQSSSFSTYAEFEYQNSWNLLFWV